MKKSTIDRKYTKTQLAEALDVNESEYTKAQLVDLMMNKINGIEPEPDEVVKTEPAGANTNTDALELDRALEIVLKEGILYRIDSHCWWGKTSRTPDGEIEAPKEVMTGVKTLIDPKHLGGFRQWKGIGERIVKKVGFPFLGLRGVYYVPKAFIKMAEAKLTECQAKAVEEADEFCNNFEFYKQEWKTTVIDLCAEKGIDETDALEYLKDEYYPNPAELRNRFVFRWTKFAITVPDSDMGILTDDQYQDEVRKQKEQAR